jgi:hypothetical protein
MVLGRLRFSAPGDIAAVLADADPADKVEIYRRLGLQLTYEPAHQQILAEAMPQAIMYKTKCPRGESNH